MIYWLYHRYKGEPMKNNGLPGWVDFLGGMVDSGITMVLLYAVYMVIA